MANIILEILEQQNTAEQQDADSAALMLHTTNAANRALIDNLESIQQLQIVNESNALKSLEELKRILDSVIPKLPIRDKTFTVPTMDEPSRWLQFIDDMKAKINLTNAPLGVVASNGIDIPGTVDQLTSINSQLDSSLLTRGALVIRIHEELGKNDHYPTSVETGTLIQELQKKITKNEQKAQTLKENIAQQNTDRLSDADSVRNSLVIDSIGKLDSYLNHRSLAYEMKDVLSDADIKERRVYIHELKGLLTAFKNNKNQLSFDNVLAQINKGIDKFNGVELRATLYKIKTALLDANTANPNFDMSAAVKAITSSTGSGNTGFKNHAGLLYAEIKRLEDFGDGLPKGNEKNTVLMLATQLTIDLGRFLNDNISSAQGPSSEKIKAFQEIFTARLHSQDAALGHNRSLISIITDIAKAIARIVTLQPAEGKASRHGIFSQTAGQKAVGALDEKVKQLEENPDEADHNEGNSPS